LKASDIAFSYSSDIQEFLDLPRKFHGLYGAVGYFSLMNVLRPEHEPLKRMFLIDLFQLADFANVSDPRDHINSLLGLYYEEMGENCS
jgi:hypothetical protein